MNKASGGDRNPIELFNILKDDQYSCLENPMDREAWWAIVHGVSRVGQDLVTKSPPPKHDVVKVLHSICQQVGKLSSGHRTEKGQFSF